MTKPVSDPDIVERLLELKLTQVLNQTASDWIDEAAAEIKRLRRTPPERRLWLWRNGDHFWAFDHLYPGRTDCGDPATLGEPAGWAIWKPSRGDPRDNDPAEIKRAEDGIRRGWNRRPEREGVIAKTEGVVEEVAQTVYARNDWWSIVRADDDGKGRYALRGGANMRAIEWNELDADERDQRCRDARTAIEAYERARGGVERVEKP